MFANQKGPFPFSVHKIFRVSGSGISPRDTNAAWIPYTTEAWLNRYCCNWSLSSRKWPVPSCHSAFPWYAHRHFSLSTLPWWFPLLWRSAYRRWCRATPLFWKPGCWKKGFRISSRCCQMLSFSVLILIALEIWICEGIRNEMAVTSRNKTIKLSKASLMKRILPMLNFKC